MQFALTYAADVFDTRTKMMGRQAAGAGFLKAALQSRPERIWCYAASRAMAEAFGREVRATTASPPELRFISWQEPNRLAAAGVLYRADPGIGEDAWNRQHHAGARSYSLCGVTHTLSSHAAMTVVSRLLSDPLYPWDAVICTSTVVRDVVRHILESEREHLKSRFGASHFLLPQLPLIPLGTHVAEYRVTDAAKAKARHDLGIAPDDIAVLFVGRLSFHGKAHPLPMFLGLEQAAASEGKRVHLLLCGTFANTAIANAFEKEARLLAPSVELTVIDGTSKNERDQAWAAADIFTSLSDNIQETFGLTPIEAMSAGLPVVVSDWNGYKDTVRDGIDGFRVPTISASPGAGMDLADRFAMHLDTYDHYIGKVSQYTAVDVDATWKSFSALIRSPELRSRMGSAGQERAASLFDWSVIFRRYQALWEELNERRRSDCAHPSEGSRARRSDRPDPYSVFRSYPTQTISNNLMVRSISDDAQFLAEQRRKLDSIGYAASSLPSEEEVQITLAMLETGNSVKVGEVAASATSCPPIQIARCLVWLMKIGIVKISDE